MRVVRLSVLGILILFVAIASLYARQIPLFEASDEAEHVIYVHTLLETGALPVIQSKDQMAQETDVVYRWNNQAHHAPLNYMLSALLISWSDRDDLGDYLTPNELIFLRATTKNNPNKWLHPYGEPWGDTHLAVYTLRAFMIAIGCGTLLMIWYGARQVFEGEVLPLYAMLFAAVIPTFVVVNSSVTNDALTIFLYTSGVAWCLRVLRVQSLTLRDGLLISVILAGIALTKLTGVSLYGVIYVTLAIGVWRGYWSWQRAAQVVVLTMIAFMLLAGWWYWRNLQLYGDPLALAATGSIWGRETPLTWAIFGQDLLRIAKSLWMMVGYLHEPVFAPNAFYWLILGLVLLAISGGFVKLVTQSRQDIPVTETISDTFIVLSIALAVVTFMLLWGTRSVDISYGRLLLPAVLPLVILMLHGWYIWLGRASIVAISPFIIMVIAVPIEIIPLAYPRLEPVTDIPDTVTDVGWSTDGLELVAVDVPQTTYMMGDVVPIDVYFRGGHPDNPALLVTLADSLRATRLGHVETLAGMADISQLSDQLYKVQVQVPIDILPDEARQPRIIMVLVQWVDVGSNERIIFDNGEGLLEIIGGTFVDGRYEADELATDVDALFGAEIQLESVTLPNTVAAGESLDVAFRWLPQAPLFAEWMLTVQLYDPDGNFVAQVDEMPYWYPTWLWAINVPFVDRRTLVIPENAPSGDYTVRVGWYRQRDDDTFERLSLPNADDDLLVLPQTVTVIQPADESLEMPSTPQSTRKQSSQ